MANLKHQKALVLMKLYLLKIVL